jgi:hypothetical protein
VSYAPLGIFPGVIGAGAGLVSLLNTYAPTPDQDADRELERFQDDSYGPSSPIDPTIWLPLAGLLAVTGIAYVLTKR